MSDTYNPFRNMIPSATSEQELNCTDEYVPLCIESKTSPKKQQRIINSHLGVILRHDSASYDV